MSATAKGIRAFLFVFLVSAALIGAASVIGLYGPASAFAQTDTTAPTVSSVVITSDTGDDEVYLDDDGVYGIGDEVEVTFTFSENVVVTGSPQLELNVGGAAKNASYDSTDGSKVVFGYTVAVGDSDTDGISIAADKLSLNGGTIKDSAENPADLSHSAMAAQSGHKVDGVRPTITSVYFIGSTSGQDDVHTSGEWFPAGVSFSENIFVGGYPGPQLKLNLEGTTKHADFSGAYPPCDEGICAFGPGGRQGTRVSFDYRIVKGDLDLDGVAINANSVVLNGGSIRDGAGNDAVLTHNAVPENSNYIVDAVPATVKSVAITSDPGTDNTYGVGDTIDVTVTFSESVRVPRWVGSNGVQMPLLELNVGGEARIARTHERETITGTTLVLSYTVQDGDNDADGISIGANKLTTQSNYGITDNYSGCCPGGENADLHHSAVADDEDHKVGSSMPVSLSTDATLKGLTLSGIDFGTFTSDTESYSATVAYRLRQTSIIPTVNHSGARYVTKLGGVTDADGTVSLALGSNVISIVVTAEDSSTTKTYTVTVTRAEPSADAALKGLTLSGIDFGTFASGTESYTATVANDVAQTLVLATLNDSRASYVTKIGGVLARRSGLWTEVSLATGANVITIEVTAEDRRTTKTYTVSVTRAAASTDATLSGLTLSGIDFGTFASGTQSYTADVTNNPTETTVTPTVNHSEASYVIKLGGVVDADGTVSLAAGENVITIEVTAEDDSTTRTYTVTVTRLITQQSNLASTDATLSALTLSGIDFGTFASGTQSYTSSVANSVSQTTVTPTVNDEGASYVIKIGGVTDADGTVSLAVGSNVITVEVTAEDDSTTKTYTVTVTRAAPPSSDASLEWLALSGIDIGDGLGDRTYVHTQTSFAASIYNSVVRTTVTAMPNHSAASYVVKLGGATDSDGEIALSVGSNVITVEVTAEDGRTTNTYTATVTRATTSAPTTGELTTDNPRVNLRTISYTHSFVALTFSIPRNRGITGTVTQRYKHDGDNFVSAGGDGRQENIFEDDLGGLSTSLTYAEAEPDTHYKWVVMLMNSQGTTVIETSLTVRTPPEPGTTVLSSDATLSGLTLSGIDFESADRAFVGPGFNATVTSYVATVANNVTETTVTPTVNHSGASYIVKLGGITDTDRRVSFAVGGNVITVEVTAEDGETTRTYTVTVNRVAPSTDATLNALTLSNVSFGTFTPGTTSYTASVANSVTQTAVTPTVNHSGASYVIKLDGVTDADGIIVLASGSNAITIEVTAEDGQTTRIYTVTVTRAGPLSSDATLSDLTLSGINFGTFTSGTTSYSAQAVNSVSRTTVTPTVSHLRASYVIKRGGVEDSNGTISLAVGKNVITVEVTAEDGSTKQTYTVNVTRADPPSTDATLSGLTLSEVDFGKFASATTSYTASVANSVSQTTVTPTVNDSGASYVIKLGGVTDADGTVTLAVGANSITVEVTAEDGTSRGTYTVTVTRAEPPSTDATLSGLTLSGVDFGTFDSTTTSYSAQVANSVSETTVSPTVNDSGASYVIKLGGVQDKDDTVPLAVGSNTITVVVTAEDGSTEKTYTVTITRAEPPSTDATLSGLTLSGVSFGTFAATTTSYTASVANSVTQTTVTPTVNDSGASYVIKLGGATDSDGTVALAVGENVITVGVTAEDGNTVRTYTVTVTRAEPETPVQESSDATLSGLVLSGVSFGAFDSTTTSYMATVANSVSQTTVTPTVNDSGASYVIKLDGVTYADGTVSLGVGANVITVAVTAEDGETTRTYRVTVTRAAPLSTDATLRGLVLSGVSFGTLASTTTSYSASVANGVTQTTITPTVNHSGATYVIKLGGVTDADGTVSLAVGANVITVEVTAQDGQTTRTYTVAVTRAAPLSTDASLRSLTLSGVDFGTFDSSTLSYTASVANDVSQTTVSPTANQSGATYVIKLDGTEDSDGAVSLAVGSNVITVEVTAQDGRITRTYTVTVTRASETADAPVTGELPTDDPRVNLRVASYGHDQVDLAWSVPNDREIAGYVVQRYEHDGTEYVSSGSDEDSRNSGTTSGGNSHTWSNTDVEPDTLYLYSLALNNSEGTAIIEVSVSVRTLSSDATLSALSMSDVDFGAFDAATTSYSADVGNDVNETTVSAAVSHSGAGYVVKLGDTEYDDGVVPLSVGENVIAVEVTAQDGETRQTYTVTVTRAAALAIGELASDDPPVNFRVSNYGDDEVSLVWEIPRNRGITEYELVRNDHEGTEFALSDWGVSGGAVGGDSVTESNTGLSADSRYRYDLSLKSDDGTVIIEKSLEVRTPASDAAALSTDSTLSALSLSGVTLDSDFSPSLYRYSSSVNNDLTQTTVTATLNDSEASYNVKLGGVADEDGVLDLVPGRNVITVHVTAEDGVTTLVYTVVVSRSKLAGTLSADASLRSLSLSGVDIGTFDSETISYPAQVAHDVSQTTVTVVRSDVESSHVIKLDGVEDSDGVVALAVGENVISVEVTAEDGETTQTYTVTVTRAEAPTTEPDPAPVDTCVQAVEADGSIDGSWDDTCLSEKDAPGGAGDRYARFYTFTLTEATAVIITLESDEDTYLYLLDEHGKGGDTIHSNDDIAAGGVNLNSRLSVTLQPGDYTIEATTYHAEKEGDFTLTIEGLGEAVGTDPDPDPEPATDECLESVDADGEIEGTWDDSCLSDRAAISGTGDRYAGFYTFTLDAATDVTITLESDKDTYLYLLEGHGRSGTVLYDEDDIDYPSNTNSRLSESLEAGDYTVEATTYYAQTGGDFTLKIEGLSLSP